MESKPPNIVVGLWTALVGGITPEKQKSYQNRSRPPRRPDLLEGKRREIDIDQSSHRAEGAD